MKRNGVIGEKVLRMLLVKVDISWKIFDQKIVIDLGCAVLHVLPHTKHMSLLLKTLHHSQLLLDVYATCSLKFIDTDGFILYICFCIRISQNKLFKLTKY
ncbi:hypothetical protein E1A91_D08G106000v1 [Gossypium mustelinum]|uniref:Uncharacterized protein n=1 Tax=Gossypium mustelinum TaxID=34275 RepID=A0A5D2TTU8_GOSMU|nr:hypothetical protein E1A91_D08G106000v1 [Gossypium mustelinum]